MGSQGNVLKSIGEYKIVKYKSEGRLLVEASGEMYIIDLEGSIFKEIAIENLSERRLLGKESGKRFTVTPEGRLFEEITIENLMAGLKKS
jgi:hypothetical protein